MRTLTITEARREFLGLPEEVQDEPVTITKRGLPVMTMLNTEYFESLLETLDILGDAVFSARLVKGIQDAEAGRTRSMAEVRARFGSAK